MRNIEIETNSLFTEEQIRKLIQQYIEWDGDFLGFHKKIYGYEPNNEDEATEVILDMIPKAITKYIFDNVIEFIEYCNDRQVRLINSVRKEFSKEVEFTIMKLERLHEDSDERKKYENEKQLYKQNINIGQIGYGIHIVIVRELINPLRQYMLENSTRALPEMISNYRKVDQAHGIVQQKIEELQEKTLTELQQELEKLKRQEKRTTQQRDEAKLLRNAYQAERILDERKK